MVQIKYRNSLISFLVLLMSWEFLSRIGFLNKTLVSMPTEIVRVGGMIWTTDNFNNHLLLSLQVLLTGLLLAIFFGTVLGILSGANKAIYDFLSPYFFILGSMPMVALVPLIIIWFGIGFSSKIAIVFIMSVSPIAIGAADGARNANSKLIWMAKSFGAESRRILVDVIFFESLPSTFSGIRIGIGKAIVGLVIAEIFGYGKGIGYLVTFYGNSYQTSKLMFVIFVLMTISLTLVWALSIIEKRVIKK